MMHGLQPTFPATLPPQPPPGPFTTCGYGTFERGELPDVLGGCAWGALFGADMRGYRWTVLGDYTYAYELQLAGGIDTPPHIMRAWFPPDEFDPLIIVMGWPDDWLAEDEFVAFPLDGVR